MPDVVEETQNFYAKRLEPEFLSETIENRQLELLQQQRQLGRLENRSGRKIIAQQLLNQNQSRKVVLLGAPGSGKTTLMSYFAVILVQKHPEDLGLATETDWLPILIRMRELVRYSDISILDYVRQFTENNLEVKKLPKDFFEYWLENGQAIILLDGLDEVAYAGKRYQVVQKIETFLEQFNLNKAIITSRPAGYKRDFFRTEEFSHYWLQPFDDDKIKEFINRWYDSRFKDKTEANRRKESLSNALSEYEKWLHRNLLFAGACLAENPKNLKVEANTLAQEIIEKLVALEIDGRDKVGNRVREQVFKTLCSFYETEFETQALQQLEAKITDEWRFLEYQAALGQKEKVTATLLKRLGDEDSNVRYSAAYALGNLGNTSETVVTALGERLADEDSNVRYSAAYALGNLGNASETVVTALGERLADEDSNVRYSAAYALGNLGNASETVVTALGESLADEDSNVRYSAAEALSKLGNTSETVVTALVESLADEDSNVRYSAAEALSKLGNTSETVVTALVERLADKDSFVSSNAAKALGNLGNTSETVVAALGERLADEDSWVRYSAAYALGNLGKQSDKVTPAVVQWIEQHQDSAYLGSGIDALWYLVTEA